MKVGDLLRETDTGDLGLVMSEVRSYSGSEAKYIMVLWASQRKAIGLDIAVIENGWVQVIK